MPKKVEAASFEPPEVMFHQSHMDNMNQDLKRETDAKRKKLIADLVKLGLTEKDVEFLDLQTLEEYLEVYSGK